MKIGGYQIIDLKNTPLNTTAVVIEGVYAKIEGTKKPLLLSGININGTEYHDAFVSAKVNDSNYEIVVYGKTITITSEDNVTCTITE